ncbi:MAG: DoxX family protein [Bacteroidota bacterium]|nr:DoxX family protein [Bacteroidota bacterium]
MNDSESNWPSYKKFVFLLLFFYFILFGTAIQFFVSYILDHQVWQKVIPWFAKAIGHPTPITTFSNGSGDTTYNYYQILFFFILACLLAFGTIFILKKERYPVLSKCLTLFLRYYIALQMFSYGLAKLYYLQFAFPSYERLDQPLGEFTPMGLLWTFMGFFKGYTMFTGALEVIGGLLLLSKRTATLGALTVFGVMINVMMLNFFYDVPVKIFSSHIVFMSVYLIFLDKDRLLRFFVLNQSIEPHKSKELLPLKYLKVKNISKWALITGFLIFSNYQMHNMKSDFERSIAGTLFYGRSNIESFRLSSKEGVIDSTAEKWHTFYQSWPGYANVKTSNGTKMDLIFEVDTLKKQVKYKHVGRDSFSNLKYELLDSGRYHLYGTLLQDSVDMVFNLNVSEEYPLINRGFHWVNEYPFSR